MEPQYPPLKIAPFADSRIGLTSFGDSWEMEDTSNGSNRGEGSPPIGLGLELGCGSGTNRLNSHTTNCGFTISQLQELQLQSLIYKYMEAGLPVPHHLVLPIWKSVASSLSGLNGALYQLYPSFFGCGSLNLEYGNGMDPEPGRCRRTDGKKWRCSKEAVPDHKYCERHIHRGRQRSRKLVEASQGTNTATTSTATSASAITNLSVNSSSSSNNFLSPKNVLHGGGSTKKTEPSL